MSNNITVSLTEEELATAISGLLFSSSVNVTSNTNEEYQKELLDLAIKLKQHKTDIKLNNIQFLKEDDYEDKWSVNLLQEFKTNLEVITFDLV